MIMKELNALFFHIPKAGGTSVKGIFEKLTPCWIPQWHMQKQDFQKVLPDYDDYFKFAFVRNPWDRIVAVFHFRKDNIKQIPKNAAFKDWIWENRHTEELGLLSQALYLENEMNFIGKIESFEEDLKKLTEILNVDLPKIPKLNQSEHLFYASYYSKDSIEIVRDWSGEDCDKFEYTFPILLL